MSESMWGVLKLWCFASTAHRGSILAVMNRQKWLDLKHYAFLWQTNSPFCHLTIDFYLDTTTQNCIKHESLHSESNNSLNPVILINICLFIIFIAVLFHFFILNRCWFIFTLFLIFSIFGPHIFGLLFYICKTFFLHYGPISLKPSL